MSDSREVRPTHLYFAASLLLLILTFVGFQLFYLKGQAYPGRPLTPPIRALLIVHGVTMTAWTFLFVIQSFLIRVRNPRLHMGLGKLGAVVALAAVYSGAQVSLGAAAVNPPEVVVWSFDPRRFLLVSLSAVALFGLFVAAGIATRKKPAAHRPLMLLASLVAVAPAIDRIDGIRHLFEPHLAGRLFGPYFPPLVIGTALLLCRGVFGRAFDRVYAAGLAFLALCGLGVMKFAATPAWGNIAAALLS